MAEKEKKDRFIDRKPVKIVAVILAFIITFTSGYYFYHFLNCGSTTLLGSALNLINSEAYLIDPETGEQKYLTEQELLDLTIDFYFDKYSEYYTSEEVAIINAQGSGNYKGFGVSIYTNSTTIYKVIGNSPAEKAGLKAGDVIKKLVIDGQETIVTDNASISEKLAVARDKMVTFVIERNGATFNFNLEAEAFIASYVHYFDSETSFFFQSEEGSNTLIEKTDADGKMIELDSKTAYIKLDLFEGDSAKQMEKALDFMQSRGREKLILDLRDNGGGYLSTLTEIASLFIYNNGQSNNVVTYARTRKGLETYSTPSNKFHQNVKKIAVMANGNSASATECLIGAMLHYGDSFSKDTLIIEKGNDGIAKTYGKGIMQTTYWLNKGGSLKITTGKMYWPDNETSIHEVGIFALEKNAVTHQEALPRAIASLSD